LEEIAPLIAGHFPDFGDVFSRLRSPLCSAPKTFYRDQQAGLVRERVCRTRWSVTSTAAREPQQCSTGTSYRNSRMPKFEPTEQEINEGPQTVSFQIANGNARQRCILQTKLPMKIQAERYLLANWPIIEKMARDALAARTREDGEIKLVMI
jgi:hypothetical protein